MGGVKYRITHGRVDWNIVTGGDVKEQRAQGDYLAHDIGLSTFILDGSPHLEEASGWGRSSRCSAIARRRRPHRRRWQ